jgi:SAM-dependent methyltransferase
MTQPNAEAIEAWNTVLFDKFVKYRDLLVTALGIHGSRAMDRVGLTAGESVVDLGCGFGDTTIEIAKRVGLAGRALGLDAAPRFIETARIEASGVANATFGVADIQEAVPGGPFDVAYSRMGMMFFTSPVIALRNVRKALRSGGRLCMVVWRNKASNEGLAGAEHAVREIVGEPDKGDQVTCGPGPFSMAGADVVTDQLVAAGFTNIALARSDASIKIGTDLDAAVDFALALGPAGELVRLAGDEGVRRRGEIEAAVRSVMTPFARSEGVFAGSSCWIVTATAP